MSVAGNTYRDGKVHVAATKCNACLLSPDRIVSGSRAAQIVKDTKDDSGATFTCHKGTLSGEDMICRGWYDKFAKDDPILRMAVAMDAIEEST